MPGACLDDRDHLVAIGREHHGVGGVLFDHEPVALVDQQLVGLVQDVRGANGGAEFIEQSSRQR